MLTVLTSLRSGLVPALLLFVFLTAAPMAVQAQGRASPVEVDEVREEPLTQTAPATGRFVAIELGPVATRVAERVESVAVRAGDRVAEGDVLARLSAYRLEAERSLMEAELKKAQAQQERASANRAKAAQTLARTEQLRGSNAFRKNVLEDDQRDLEAAEASVAESEAETARARAELRLAEIALSDATIRAPFPGVVLTRHVVAGDHVQIGEAIVTLMNDEALEIEADVPGQRLSGLTPGVPVDARLQDGRALRASVRAVIPEENPRTRSRAVRFTPELTDDAVRIAENQGVTVFIPIGNVRQVVSVHKDALLLDRTTPRVYVVRDGKAEPRSVRVGEALGNRFEVLEGLAPGDMVVIKGNERLRPGQAVAVQVKG